MKDQNYSFLGADILAKGMANRNKPGKAFDWDKAAAIIKERLKTNPNLIAEAGLEGDWAYTGGVIFSDGKPVSDEYTYLYSTWAIPTLIIDEKESFECWIEDGEHRFDSHTKWDEQSLAILNDQKLLK